MKDIVVVMDTSVGRPTGMLEALAVRDVEFVAGCFFPRIEGRVAHVAVHDEDAAAVREVATELGGLVLDEREVLVIEPEQVSSVAQVARTVSDAGAVVNVAYFGVRGQLVIATSDLQVAREALGVT